MIVKKGTRVRALRSCDSTYTEEKIYVTIADDDLSKSSYLHTLDDKGQKNGFYYQNFGILPNLVLKEIYVSY